MGPNCSMVVGSHLVSLPEATVAIRDEVWERARKWDEVLAGGGEGLKGERGERPWGGEANWQASHGPGSGKCRCTQGDPSCLRSEVRPPGMGLCHCPVGRGDWGQEGS